MKKKSCEHCGSVFVTDKRAQRFCTVECRRLASGEKMRKRARERYRERNGTDEPEPTKQVKTAAEIDKEARKNRRSYGYQVAATEYPVKIVRKW